MPLGAERLHEPHTKCAVVLESPPIVTAGEPQPATGRSAGHSLHSSLDTFSSGSAAAGCASCTTAGLQQIDKPSQSSLLVVFTAVFSVPASARQTPGNPDPQPVLANKLWNHEADQVKNKKFSGFVRVSLAIAPNPVTNSHAKTQWILASFKVEVL